MIKKPLLIFSTLLLVVIASANIKHVPLMQLVGVSGSVITFGGLAAVGIKIGFTNLKNLFVGRAEQADLKLTTLVLTITAGIGILLGFDVLLNNLNNPDAIGPATVAALIPILYSAFLIGFFWIANHKQPHPETQRP